jgi:hypothetical protein
MKEEFSAACTSYYRHTGILADRETYFQTLLNAAPAYTGETDLADLDQIIGYNSTVQQARADVEETQATLRELQAIILKMMEYFELPPGTRLKGAIPGELEFEIIADDQGTLYCKKTKDLKPLVEDPNFITINLCNENYGRPW